MSEELDLRGRHAVVTGGSRGIGRAIVAALLARGARVLATGRDPAHLAALQRELAAGDALETAACDQADPAAVDRLFDDLEARWPAVDLLVNNAAIGVFGSVEETTVDAWDMSMNVNARGPSLLARRAFAWMRRTGGGRIVNVSSVVGHKGYVNQLAYTASKHALMGLTKVIAREGQPYGIRGAAVCPGGVDTEMVGDARPDLDRDGLIRPADVARAVLYLATEPATCCTDVLYLRRPGSTPFA